MSSIPTDYRYLFGPVPSRRLGLSLGVDLTPMKTCTLDCVFCEVGRTTHHVTARAEFVPIEDVTGELGHWADAGGQCDFVTLAGSGEPTLHVHFHEVIRFAAGRGFRTALLSNGTLFTDADVRRAAAAADVVKLSLGAWDQASFERLNRPAEGIRFEGLIQAYRQFRHEFSGRLWLEVFVVPGINADRQSLARIAGLARTVRPDRIDLNTAVRPPADTDVAAVSSDFLSSVAGLFTPVAEVAASFPVSDSVAGTGHRSMILRIVRRRPCTAEQIAAALNLPTQQVLETLEKARQQGSVLEEVREGNRYFFSRQTLT